jgi:hypothetical protein
LDASVSPLAAGQFARMPAQRRDVQAKPNIGITASRNIEYAKGYKCLTPEVVESLS